MWFLLGALAAGCLMGWGSCDMHYLAHKDVIAKRHKEDLDEQFAEITRLRTQVANLIGCRPTTSVLDCTAGQSACQVEQANCLLKPA